MFMLSSMISLGFPGGLGGKESACNARDLGSIPRSGRSSGEGRGYPLQYSRLENPMDRGAWWSIIQGVAERHTDTHRHTDTGTDTDTDTHGHTQTHRHTHTQHNFPKHSLPFSKSPHSSSHIPHIQQ